VSVAEIHGADQSLHHRALDQDLDRHWRYDIQRLRESTLAGVAESALALDRL